jgi:hypothetical protein
MQIERWRKRVQRLTYAAGLAACLSLGLGIGRLSAPASEITVAGPDHGDAVQLVDSRTGHTDSHGTYTGDDVLVRSNPPDAERGFWSVDRLIQQREQDQAQPRNQPSHDIRLPLSGWNRPT